LWRYGSFIDEETASVKKELTGGILSGGKVFGSKT